MPDFSKFKDKVHVTVTPEGLRIDLVEESEGLFFDIGKATVKPETVKLLKMIATHLAHLAERHRGGGLYGRAALCLVRDTRTGT